MKTLTIIDENSVKEECAYCYGSKKVISIRGSVRPCPLCHGGKISNEKMKEINKNYQDLMEEFEENGDPHDMNAINGI